MAQVAEVGCTSAFGLYLNRNLNLDFFFFLKMTLNVAVGEIFSVNTEQFWFEHYPAGHRLRRVVPLAFFKENN